MPVIHTHVSVSTTPEQREALKAAYGKAITAVPGKSEGWLMCPFEDNMPIYFGYNDALLCLQKTGKYAGLTLEKTNVATEIIVATTTRNAEDPRTMFRHVIMQNKNANPAFFGLRNIQFGVSNLPTAIMGSYSDMGIDSILVHPPKKLEKYEKLLRM